MMPFLLYLSERNKLTLSTPNFDVYIKVKDYDIF